MPSEFKSLKTEGATRRWAPYACETEHKSIRIQPNPVKVRQGFRYAVKMLTFKVWLALDGHR